MSAFPINFIVRPRGITYDFPAKKAHRLSKRMRIGAAKHDDVFRIKGYNKVLVRRAEASLIALGDQIRHQLTLVS